MKVNVEIHNMQEGYGEPYIVARLINGEFWYYGRYETKERAKAVAVNFDNAIVMWR